MDGNQLVVSSILLLCELLLRELAVDLPLDQILLRGLLVVGSTHVERSQRGIAHLHAALLLGEMSQINVLEVVIDLLDLSQGVLVWIQRVLRIDLETLVAHLHV